MFTASQLLDKINNYISEIQFTREPKGLYEPIEYILSLGGKRIRPVLMLMAYNLYREDVASIYDPAAAIEVYHNHTLLHDDLMDRSAKPKKPSIRVQLDAAKKEQSKQTLPREKAKELEV